MQNVRKKLALQRVGASAVTANTTYYLILALGGAIFANLGLLRHVE